MSRAEVIASVLSIGEHMVPEGVDLEALHHLTALAILGALSEYAAGERTVATSNLFDRIRSAAEPVETAGSGDPLAPDPASPAGVDATIREDVGAPTERPRPSAPAVNFQGGAMPDGVYLLDEAATSPSTAFVPSDEVAKPETPVPDDGLNPSFDRQAPAPEPFACSGCGKTFDTTSNLGRHRRFCAGLVTRNPAPAPVRPPAEPIGEHPCEYCGRMFTSGAALAGHQTYCAGAKRARLAKRQGARIPDPPAAALGPPDPVETTVDQIPPGMALICSTCDTVYRNAAVLNSHTYRAHGRTATREERTPQRVEAVG